MKQTENKGCVTLWPCHAFTLNKILRQQKELWKLKYFTIQKYNLQKHPLNETKILQDIIYDSITILKFQHKPR
jgi:hypothetical protein